MIILLTNIQSFLKSHLVPFVTYLAAFISPVGAFIVTIQLLMITNLMLDRSIEKKNKVKIPTDWRNFVISIGLTVWLILILRVCDYAFFENICVTSKFIAGYIIWQQLKKMIKKLDLFTGGDLWNYIEETINKIKS